MYGEVRNEQNRWPTMTREMAIKMLNYWIANARIYQPDISDLVTIRNELEENDDGNIEPRDYCP
jgi:hypothetical protein